MALTGPTRYPSKNFITAVPAGASETGTINIPPGLYHLFVVGTQTAATTDPTLAIKVFIDSAQSAAASLTGALPSDSTYAANVDLEVADTTLYISYANMASVVGQTQPVFVPYGLQYVYTKNGGTAVDLTLFAVRVER